MQYDEKELFMHIANGDEKAFRVLFDQYRERLFFFAWQLCHSAVEAEEVVQDIFLRLWENRSKLGEVDFPRKYIYIMARNRTLDLLSKIARHQQLISEVWTNMSQSDNYLEDLLHAQDSRLLIDQAVSQLAEKKQAIFLMSRRDGLSLREIADQTGLSVQTVKNILTEVLKHVKAFLARHNALLAIVFWIQTCSILF
jgi:RNA polymerase sigma-70 factor (family 1)